MQKALDAHADPYLAILDFRNTPTEGYSTSPAQRMLNRRTRTLLPMSNRLLRAEIPSGVQQSQKVNQAKQAFYYDRNKKELQPLVDGDVVRVRPRVSDKKFVKAKVEKQVDVRSYNVRTEDGRMFRRNRKDLHKTAEEYDNTMLSDSPEVPQPTPQLKQVPSPETPEAPDKPEEAAPPVTPTIAEDPVRTRSGRTVRKPTYLSDFVRY